MKQLWVIRWRSAGVPESVVTRFYERYGAPPEGLTQQVIQDDGRMGIGVLSIPYSPAEVRVHDLEMLLDKLGFPITSIAQTQEEFGEGTLKAGGLGAIIAATAIPVAVVGCLAGAGIMAWRHLFGN